MGRRPRFSEQPVDFDPWEQGAVAMRDVLEERGAQRDQVRVSRTTFTDWRELVPEPRGPVDLKRFPFQAELYGEHAVDDREQVFQKATQIGVSTQSIRVAAFHADVRQHVVLYTFPTDGELADFSRQRIAPMMQASEHLQDRVGATNNVGLRQFGAAGWIYFRGTNTPIESIPADLVIFDEYDSSDQENIERSERRVTGLDSAGLIRRVGVPLIPSGGISEIYEQSDQRVWTVRCEACNDWNPIRGHEAFLANVDQEAVQLVCRKCRRPLDVRHGEWVAGYPDRDVRGYHIPKLVVPGRRTLADVIKNSRKTKDFQVEAFHNRDLGVGYASPDARLALEQIQACVRNDLVPVDPWAPPPSSRPRFMGIDVASKRALNVTIEQLAPGGDDVTIKLWAGEIEDDPSRGKAIVQLCRLMDRLGIAMCGIDASPDGRMSAELARQYPGRVYQIGFFEPSGDQKKLPATWNVDDIEQYVSLWRTRAYDALFDRYRRQQVLLPPLDLLPPDWPAHMGNLYRKKTEITKRDADGKKQPTGKFKVDYLKSGPEDYAQADAYCLAAVELYWRAIGLGMVLGQGVVPLADLDPAARLEDDEHDPSTWLGGGEPSYQDPFS